jgi:serine/threonine protein phosphatase PrpC
MAAHRQILHYAIENAMLDSPRTTIVVALIQAGGVTWTHCGDSRLYMVRQSALLARTRDHSFTEQGANRKPLLKEQDRSNRNILYTCLGSPTKPIFELTGPVSMQQGDRLMLCSDGLWSSLSEDDIVFDLGQKPVGTAVPELVEKALRKAGDSSDNVTCIAMEWETPDAFESTQGLISTNSISNGVFASTVQSGWLDATLEEMDDASIERSIAEINAAIRRSSEKKN